MRSGMAGVVFLVGAVRVVVVLVVVVVGFVVLGALLTPRLDIRRARSAAATSSCKREVVNKQTEQLQH